VSPSAEPTPTPTAPGTVSADTDGDISIIPATSVADHRPPERAA
jgi:hypothetical protein